MMKKLMLILILGMIMSGPAAPILAAYAGDGNDQGQNEDYDGDFVPVVGAASNSRQYRN